MNPNDVNMKQAEAMHATYVRRAFAYIIDFIVFVGIYFLLKPFLNAGSIVQNDFFHALLGFVALNAILLLYLSTMESSQLQGSFGKYLLKIKVANNAGGRSSFRAALARNAVKLFTCCWLLLIVFRFDTIRAQLEIGVLLSISTNPIWHDFMAVTDGEKFRNRLVHDEIARTQVIMA